MEVYELMSSLVWKWSVGFCLVDDNDAPQNHQLYAIKISLSHYTYILWIKMTCIGINSNIYLKHFYFH